MTRQKLGHLKKFVTDFKCMVKSGEVYTMDKFSEEYDHNNCLMNREDRPRMISVPGDDT